MLEGPRCAARIIHSVGGASCGGRPGTQDAYRPLRRGSRLGQQAPIAHRPEASGATGCAGRGRVEQTEARRLPVPLMGGAPPHPRDRRLRLPELWRPHAHPRARARSGRGAPVPPGPRRALRSSQARACSGPALLGKSGAAHPEWCRRRVVSLACFEPPDALGHRSDPRPEFAPMCPNFTRLPTSFRPCTPLRPPDSTAGSPRSSCLNAL